MGRCYKVLALTHDLHFSILFRETLLEKIPHNPYGLFVSEIHTKNQKNTKDYGWLESHKPELSIFAKNVMSLCYLKFPNM